MRKVLIGIITLSLLLTMLTGCANDDESSESNDSSIQTTATSESGEKNEDTSDSSTQESDSQTEQGTVTSKAPEGNTTKTGGYEAAMRDYFQSVNQNDYKKIMGFMYPNKVLDAVFSLYATEEELKQAFSLENSDTTYEVTDIVKEGTMSNDDLEQMMDGFDKLVAAADAYKTYGEELDSMTATEREAIFENNLKEMNGHCCNITEAYDVTVSYLQNGKADEDYFYVYYIQGDGWKLDNSLRKYIRKSKQSLANSTAKQFCVVYRSALVMLDSNGVDVSGTYIIGSNDSMNVNVPPSVNVANARKTAEEMLNKPTDYDYFAIMHNDDCVYTALYKKDNTSYLGTYPQLCVPKSISGGRFNTDNLTRPDKHTLDEIFQIAKNVVNSADDGKTVDRE